MHRMCSQSSLSNEDKAAPIWESGGGYVILPHNNVCRERLIIFRLDVAHIACCAAVLFTQRESDHARRSRYLPNYQPQAELDALLPSVLDRAFKGEL